MDQSPRESSPYDYEVDLREYIEVIWREKWLILVLFLIGAGAAYGFSKMQPPQYRTGTTLLITPRISEQLGGDQEEGLFSTSLSPNVYKKSAMADDLIQGIIDDLDLKADGELISVSSLEQRLSVNVELSENGTDNPRLPLVTMTVSGTEPGRVKRIANKWADLFVEKNTELLSSETARSYEFISGRFSEVSENLTAREQQKLEYKKQHPLELLKSELQVLQGRYRDFLSQLQTKRARLAERKARLKSLNDVLAEEPKFLELERSIPGISLWNLLQKEKYEGEKPAQDEQTPSQLKEWTDLKIQDQAKNNIYFNLRGEKRNVQVDIDSLQEEIAYLENRTQELAGEIEKKQFEIDQAELKLKQLDREINRLDNTYNTLSENLEEARIAKEEKESSIRIMERAVTPERPMGTNTRQNVAVAGVLGLFIGVLAAFFKNYMQDYESDEEQTDPGEDNDEVDKSA